MSHKIIMVSVIVIMSFPAYALNVAQQAEMVVAHNIYRAEVGAPPIKYSGSLATTAQAWADNLKTNKSCNLEHSKGSGLGENIFWAGAVTWAGGKIGKQDVTLKQRSLIRGAVKKRTTHTVPIVAETVKYVGITRKWFGAKQLKSAVELQCVMIALKFGFAIMHLQEIWLVKNFIDNRALSH